MNANETLTVGQGQSCRIIVVSSDGPETLAGPGGEWRIVACRDFSMHLVLERDASAEILALMFPGADSSMDFNVELDGPGADCRLSGIYLCPGSEKARVNVLMSHKSGHCSSGQKFKGNLYIACGISGAIQHLKGIFQRKLGRPYIEA